MTAIRKVSAFLENGNRVRFDQSGARLGGLGDPVLGEVVYSNEVTVSEPEEE